MKVVPTVGIVQQYNAVVLASKTRIMFCCESVK